MKVISIKSDFVKDVVVETHNNFNTVILTQGKDNIVLDADQLAQLVSAQQSAKRTASPAKTNPDSLESILDKNWNGGKIRRR